MTRLFAIAGVVAVLTAMTGTSGNPRMNAPTDGKLAAVVGPGHVT